MLHSNRGVQQGFFMKRLVLAVSVLGISAASALAADLAPYTKAPAVPAGYDWSGVYLGVNGGYGSASHCWDLNQLGTTAVLGDGCSNATGGVAGGQFMYRFQATRNLVVGMEAQGDWAGLKGSNASSVLSGVINQSKVDAFGLFTGHFGWAVDNSLLYVKTGIAVTDNQFNGLGALSDQGTQTRLGYAAGIGYEYAFARNWTAAIEYNHFFMFQSADNLNFASGALSRVESIQQDIDLVTVKVDYHFGGPVVAKY
jgi:outer membrane immunogenic protein